MTSYKKFRNFQCPTCVHNDEGICTYGCHYRFDGVKFKGVGSKPCPNYEMSRFRK